MNAPKWHKRLDHIIASNMMGIPDMRAEGLAMIHAHEKWLTCAVGECLNLKHKCDEDGARDYILTRKRGIKIYNRGIEFSRLIEDRKYAEAKKLLEEIERLTDFSVRFPGEV